MVIAKSVFTGWVTRGAAVRFRFRSSDPHPVLDHDVDVLQELDVRDIS